MKRLRSRGRRLALWFAMLAVILYAGCGIVTMEDKEEQEIIDQAMAYVASMAAEQESDGEAPQEAGGFVEMPSVSREDAFTEAPSAAADGESGESAAGLWELGLVELLDEDGSYTTCEDVALYLEIYEKLPDNFITKQEARDLGWEGGSLEAYAPGKCIGGDKFGNYEGLLPEAEGRSYRECDIDTLGADSRGAKRIVYSNDGLIYYTEDHYASFTLIYN